jgi:hypothetical protein
LEALDAEPVPAAQEQHEVELLEPVVAFRALVSQAAYSLLLVALVPEPPI